MEEQLVPSLLAQEPGAWERFVSSYGGLVAAVARRILSTHGAVCSPSDVDDIVENVFGAFIEKDGELLRRYDPSRKLSTYVAVVTRTQAHRFLRKLKPKADISEETLQGLIPDPTIEPTGAALARREALDVLRECIAGLGEREQRLLRLFYYEGADYRTIATTLGISANSVGAALTRAREHLQRDLQKATDLTESDFRTI